VGERLRATQGAKEALINTAYIERLQATFRCRLAPLVRKTRDGATEGHAGDRHMARRDGLQLLPHASLSEVGRGQSC
jgi:hypothetical protein